MALTKFDIITQGLVLIGEEPLATFDGSVAGIAAGNLYDSFLEGELAGYPWKFTIRTLEMGLDSTVPGAPWTSRWEIPPDSINVLTVRVGSKPINYEIRGNFVCCKAEVTAPPVIEYQYKPAILYWSKAFRQAFVYRLAGLFGSSVATKVDLAQYWMEQADDAFDDAQTRDSQQATAKKMSTNRFRTVRR